MKVTQALHKIGAVLAGTLVIVGCLAMTYLLFVANTAFMP